MGNGPRAFFCSTRCHLLASIVANEDGCWIWQKAIHKDGYPEITLRNPRRKTFAHVVAMRELAGVEIPKGLEVCHRCDRPACINPDHLFLGTHAENVEDMRVKGRARAPKGEEHKNAVVTAETVRAIRASPMRGHGAARAFGLSITQYYRIRNGESWRHLLAEG